MTPREDRKRIDREAAIWFVRLADDPEDAPLRAQFALWLTTGPLHRAAWDEMRALDASVGVAGADRSRSGTARQDAVLGSARTRPFRIRPRMAIAIGIAACVAWATGPDLRIRVTAQAFAPAGQLQVIALRDGSHAWLAPGAAIAFTTRPNERRLTLLRGTTFLDVAHDPAHPFRVETDRALVSVLGTAFEVSAGEPTHVAVARGLVSVADRQQHELGRLRAGEAIAFGAAIKPERRSIQIDRIATWRVGQLIVNDRPVGEVIAAIRPWYPGYIVARGAGLARDQVTGVYDLRHPDDALAALARARPIRIDRITSRLRIVTAD